VENLLEVDGLKTFFYTSGRVVRAIDEIGFQLGQGEIMGLVGETGCGKSVTALSILRLIYYPPGRIIGGRILFERRDLLQLSERKIREEIRGKRISMIFQEPRTSMNPVFRISQQMTEVIMLHQKLTKKMATSRAIDMLERVRIPDASRVFHYYPHELSGGMLQRAMIAMELSCRPSLFIADEPTTALDVTIQAQILNLMRKMQREMNMAILLISHDLGVVAQICQKVGVMYAGRMVEQAPVERIFQTPAHPYTQGLFKSIMGLGRETERLEIIPGEVPDLTAVPAGCAFHPRCERASQLCRQERPSRREIHPDHFVYCHF
jgi:oligopeptide/dipeptide ABC transporter ATP-binding protein